MRNLIFFATIVATTLLVPTLVKAQGYPYGGAATTIYVPSIETTTTTTTTQVTPTVTYPNNNSFGTSTITTYSNGYPFRHRRQYRQPTVIIQQQNTYPYAGQSTCSTSIIGSPIPSPVALDRSGRPCR